MYVVSMAVCVFHCVGLSVNSSVLTPVYLTSHAGLQCVE